MVKTKKPSRFPFLVIAGNEFLRDFRKKPASEREMLNLDRINDEEKVALRQVGTLCWHCENAMVLGCRWMQGFHPVNGWVAEEGITETGATTYLVMDCPEFKPCRPRIRVDSIPNNVYIPPSFQKQAK